MRLQVCLFLLAATTVVACDPDTSPITTPASSDSGVDSSASGGSGGGTAGGGGGGAAGSAGDAGSAGEAGSSGEGGGGGDAGAGGGQPDAGPDAAQGCDNATGYCHTIVIDGTNDFDATKEKFATTSVSPDAYSVYATWDTTFLYVGMEGSAIGLHRPSDFVVAYIGGTPGSTTGLPYKAQQPTLPFNAGYHVRWKVDGSYTNSQRYDSGSQAWVDAGWLIQVATSGNFVEMRIARASIGSPTTLPIVVSMLREETGQEWTWAGMPSTTFTDGADPNYTKYFEFDLGAATAPSSYSPLP